MSAFAQGRISDVVIAPTPRDTVHRDGTASLYHFRSAGVPAAAELPVLVVPSMINRWFVVDLRKGSSLCEALVQAGHDVWCLDWGIPQDEDRYLSWEDVMGRLHRAVKVVQRKTGAPKVGLLGYCMGATLSGIYSSLHPDRVAAFTNLAGPFDFSEAGLLGVMTDPRWFDPEAITAPGNLQPPQMQSGFVSLRPTAQISKWVRLFENWHDPKVRESFDALEAWANDNIPFPAAAYVTYITELYQQNRLIQGTHYVAGERVDLKNLTCPVLTITTAQDTIVPMKAALALNEHCGSDDTTELVISGGHVGAVVGSKARRQLYPAIAAWFAERLSAGAVGAAPDKKPSKSSKGGKKGSAKAADQPPGKDTPA